MALRSMTGYGRATGRSDAWSVEVECRSVNRNRLEVRVHLPGEMSALEPVVRDRVEGRMGRGKIDVSLSFELRSDPDREPGTLFDPERFQTVVGELQELSKRTATGPVGLGDIVQFRDLFERQSPFEVAEDDPVLLEAIDEALEELLEARTSEGVGLAGELLEYLDRLEARLDDYRAQAPEEMSKRRDRIEQRVRDALEDFDGSEPDSERLAEEIVYYADRADVSEELQRVGSHIENLRQLIGESPIDEPVGKEIDFYLQELVRETNTLSSKSATSELTEAAVSMKALVEKMREQAANVE